MCKSNCRFSWYLLRSKKISTELSVAKFLYWHQYFYFGRIFVEKNLCCKSWAVLDLAELKYNAAFLIIHTFRVEFLWKFRQNFGIAKLCRKMTKKSICFRNETKFKIKEMKYFIVQIYKRILTVTNSLSHSEVLFIC